MSTIITLSGQSLQKRLRVALSEAEALEAKYAEFENASSGGLILNTKPEESVYRLPKRNINEYIRAGSVDNKAA